MLANNGSDDGETRLIQMRDQRQFDRRRMLLQSGLGMGSIALQSLDSQAVVGADTVTTEPRSHFPATAKNVIYLFMVGGPSQLDMIDYKPELARFDGQPLPESCRKFQNFAQIKEKQPKIMSSPWKFNRYGETGRNVSELLPHTATVVDDLAMIRSVNTEETVHPFAEMMFNTGYREYGKPGIGAWVSYGLGSETDNLPAYIVLQSGGRLRGKGANYSNGFLPPTYQGVPFRTSGDPVLNLFNPPVVSAGQLPNDNRRVRWGVTIRPPPFRYGWQAEGSNQERPWGPRTNSAVMPSRIRCMSTICMPLCSTFSDSTTSG